MFDTYKMMSEYSDKDMSKIDMNELARRFKTETNPVIKNKIYATLFVNMFPMMLKLQKTHGGISNEDKTEICMEKLLSALKSFDGKKVKFSTYYHTCLNNHFLTFETQQRCSKRKIWSRIVQDEQKTNNALKKLQSGMDSTFKLFKKIKDAEELTLCEKEYCACALAGYKHNEITNKMELAKRIKDLDVTNPLYAKENIRLAGKVKEGLKLKLKSCLFD